MKKIFIALLALAMVAGASVGAAAGQPAAPSAMEAAAQCVEDAWVAAQDRMTDEGQHPSVCGPINPRLWDSFPAADTLETWLAATPHHFVWVWGRDGELDKVESAVIRTPNGWACDTAFWAARWEASGRSGPAPDPILYANGAYPFAKQGWSPATCPAPWENLDRFATSAPAPVVNAPARRPAPKAQATAPAAPAVVSTPVVPVAPVADATSAPKKGGEVKAGENWEERSTALLAASRLSAREDAAWEQAGRPAFRLGVEGNADLGAYSLQDSYRGVRYAAVKLPALGWAVSLGMSQTFGLPMAKPEPEAQLGTIATLSVEGYGGGLQYGGIQAGVRAGLVWAKTPMAPLAVGWRFGVKGDAYGVFTSRGAGSLMLPGVGTTHEVVFQLGPALNWKDAGRAPMPTLWVAGGVYAPLRWSSAWATKPGLVLPSPTVSVGFALQAR